MTSERHENDAPAVAPAFTGTDRYEVRRRLGAGSFGVVYEAFDHARSSSVALKWLRYADGETIFRFKNEFRSLAEISHPNLVTLFDLESDGDRWFFTMEHVRGEPVPSFLRPDGRPVSFGTGVGSSTVMRRRAARMRAAAEAAAQTLLPGDRRPMDVDANEVREVFGQLALGVQALHDAGKLHRDLKCQNVLVTPDGRVVLLDFGMVRELRASRETDTLDVAGTPLYMAPEQCAGAPVDRPADWYAFGVMLFRALTDEFPFTGRTFEVMTAKQTRDADAPSELVRDLPQELDLLCAALLRRDPASRPDGASILAALGAEPRGRVSYPSVDTEVFVGRRRQLRGLEVARRRVRDGQATAAYVHGPSGIGKTALVRHFLERVVADDPTALVLRGRCYERETLPYKALDSVVDDLAEQLLRWSRSAQSRVVPADVQELVQVFPTLVRVPAFRDATQTRSEASDPQERRRRAVSAFEELLGRLAADRHVVVFMDDLQWGDGDSAQLVRPLLHGPNDPAVLWIGTYRTAEAGQSAYLEAMHASADTDAATVMVEVPELDEEEARTLLELRLSGTARSEALLDELARDAAGSPLLIDLLVRHARDRERGAPIDLSVVLTGRLDELPDHARELLELLALRGRPLPLDLAAELLSVDAFDVRTLTQLRNAKLLKGDDALELYHDRIRETVTASLTPEREQGLHRRLADALRARPDADAEALARHYAGAGDHALAFEHTVAAARHAESTLAFDRAAELYRTALGQRAKLPRAHGPIDVGALRVGLANALRDAGRGAAAAGAYLDAAEAAAPRRAQELRRLGAEQFLFSGHVDEGRAVLRRILDGLGIGFPESSVRVLAEFLARRAQVRLRGLSFRERGRDQISEEELFRIDVCWSIAIGFAMIDPVRGGIFQARHLLMALDAGELSRVARAVAVEVPFSATSGIENQPRTEELMRIGRELAERAGDPYVRGLLASSSGGARWLQGRWAEGLELEEEALRILRGECAGAAWEIASSTIVLLDALWRMGRWGELFERWPDVLADAVRRGDLLLEIYCRVKFGALAHLAAGRTDDAIREASAALSRWSQTGFTLLHLWELFSSTEAQLYAGRPEAAYARVDAMRSTVRASGLLQLQMYDVTWRDLEGRVALACVARAHGRRRSKLVDEVARAAARIDKAGAPWGRGLASALRAGVAKDKSAAARDLARAERAFVDADMSVHAAVMRARAAELQGDAAALDAELEALEELGLREPSRWLALLAPGGASA
ncbi:MAG: protein kinase [Sandaracinaceae bacterium]|nr:protein kinase [Sandaracinaceae bacterium]